MVSFLFSHFNYEIQGISSIIFEFFTKYSFIFYLT
ncbi:hypothetical protein X474_25575 [Dethiosulfatarculus sandiegensis]|uniref:Uncharacterized protein n=1 Tax=Dethiosulfatarculus sandiegensis TaxID=1429043 RepID=A0A0D2HKN6_9BACT|nr:hypothetical protein X474_25575 [Dethiosulfatarculus sandiegensis]